MAAGLLWAFTAAAADELSLPHAVERQGSIEAAYRFDRPMTGHGVLTIEWTDTAGRVVERRRIQLDLTNAPAVPFSLDARRAVTVENKLAAHLSLDRVDGSGGTTHREADETASFIASPADQGWRDYQIIMWQTQNAAALAALKRLGITAGMVEADHRDESGGIMPDQLPPLLQQNLRFYVENIGTDFYSPYHKWSGDRPVNWRFLEAKQRYRANPQGIGAFIRDPSLSDPAWLDRIADRLTRTVRALHFYRPLYYSLGDETGIADLAAFWDFDLSDYSLAAMRNWLKERYGSLTALNRQWGSAFGSWEEVVPMTTAVALERSDDNFSAWADFKEWMDVAFADAIARGTAAVHAADPDAVSAIEGGQIPGWGGYDYSRLATSVDAVELYDYGRNIELLRSFNPKMILLTTSFLRGPAEAHRVWNRLLRGSRGLVLWDEEGGFVDKDGSLGERGREAAPYFGEIRSGIGALLINSRRHADPIGVIYSPESMRLQWLLDRKASGEDWTQRNASAEYQADPIRTSTAAIWRAIEHIGLQPRFVSSRGVAQGALRDGHYRIVLLPHTIALSPETAKEIQDFVAQGGIAVADGEPGIFDEHGRKAAAPLLSEVFTGPATRSQKGFAFGNGKAMYLGVSEGRGADRGRQRIGEILTAAGLAPLFPATRPDGTPVADVETRIFENGGTTIVALQRDLSAAGPTDHETVVLALPHPFHVYDLRAQRAFGETDRVTLDLDPIGPALLALSETPPTMPTISGPRAAHPGDNVEFSIRSGSPEGLGVFHIEIVDPDGVVVAHYSGNLPAPEGAVAKLIPLAVNDKTGVWQIRVRDVLGGAAATAELRVEP